MKRYLKKKSGNIQHIVEELKDNVKAVEKSMRFVKIRRILYKVSQREQVNCSVVRSETGKAIRVTNMPMTTTYIIPYLMIIQRRCLFCLMEYKGARICFDGRSQNSRVAWKRSK